MDEAVAQAKGRERAQFGILKVIEALIEQGQTERARDVFKSEVNTFIVI